MPKPTRRQRRMGKAKPPRRPTVSQKPAPTPAKVIEATSALPKTSIVPGEYNYVYKDLRRIAALAGMMFTALLILSFILK